MCLLLAPSTAPITMKCWSIARPRCTISITHAVVICGMTPSRTSISASSKKTSPISASALGWRPLLRQYKLHLTVNPKAGRTAYTIHCIVLSDRFRYAFYPSSTWTMSRNRLAKLGHLWEQEQNWRFQYFVFFDEDVLLANRTLENPHRVLVDIANDDAAVRKFNEVLLRDRPMKAGVSFNEFDWNKDNLRCMSRCQVDSLVMAYHGTASRFLEPYSSHFESTNWWLSAYMLNMYVSAIGAEHCANYNEVLVDRKTQVHHLNYPHSGDMWNDAVTHVNKCLAEENFSDFSVGSSVATVAKRIQTSLDREPKGWPDCLRNPPGVDFGEMLRSKAVNLPPAGLACQ